MGNEADWDGNQQHFKIDSEMATEKQTKKKQ